MWVHESQSGRRRATDGLVKGTLVRVGGKTKSLLAFHASHRCTQPPWWAIAWLWDEGVFEDLQKLHSDLLLKEGDFCTKSVAHQGPREAAPHRAPPRERALSTGTSIPPRKRAHLSPELA